MDLSLGYVAMYIIIFVVGIFVGSFLNVIISKIEKGAGFISGRLSCLSCNHKLEVLDLVPVFSYMFLGGKCRYCKEKISSRYMWVELFTGLIFVASFVAMGLNLRGIYVCILSAVLICISLIDYDTMEIPDFLTVIVAIIGLVGFLVFPEISIQSRLVGALIVSVPMYILNRFVDGAFGEGDVFLIGAVGVVTGWIGVLLAMFIALIIGGIIGLCLLITKKVGRNSHISFGQYICIGAWISICFANEIITMYLGFVTP